MKAPGQKSNKLVTIAKLAILVAILTWIISTFPKKDWDTLISQPKDWSLLGMALLIVLAAHLITFWRWQILVNALGVPMSLLEAIRLGFLGTMLNMVSVGAVGGDLFKAIAAARKTEKKRAEVVTSVLVDRAIGLLGLIIVAAISLSFPFELTAQLQWIHRGAVTLALIGLAVIAAIVIFGHHLPIKQLNRIPGIGPLLYRIANACMVFQGRPILVLQMLLATLVVHSFSTTAAWFVSRALYATAPTLGQHFQAIPPALAAATLPLTPGGVGVQEVAIQTLFNEVEGIPEGFSGLIVAAMIRVILIIIALIGAAVYFTGNERRWIEVDDGAVAPDPSHA